MSTVVLVPGTWANQKDQPEWWHLDSLFANKLFSLGHKVLSFTWDTNLDGVLGPDTDWIKAGKRFRNIVPTNAVVIAHSHGGNVAAIGISQGRMVKQLITIATPVRPDIPYDHVRPYLFDSGAHDSWIHIYGNYQDYVQLAGELAIGRFWRLRREMEYADQNIQYPASHSELHDPVLWTAQNWWNLVK